MTPEPNHLAAFLEMLSSERGAAQNTLDAYERDLSAFLGFMASRNRVVEAADSKGGTVRL